MSGGTRMYANDRLWAPSRGSDMLYQTAGNLVLYTSDGTAVWITGTHGNPGAYLEMGDDASLAVRSADGSSTLRSR